MSRSRRQTRSQKTARGGATPALPVGAFPPEASPTPRPHEPADRLALGALVLLALALHARDLFVGYADEDLKTLDAVVTTSFAVLMRGSVLADGFTPLSRELYLWWWGKTVGVGALGFHLLGAAMAGVTLALLYRAGERWAGARAGLIAATTLVAFAPLGTMLSAVSGSRELVALLWSAAALALFARERWVWAGVAAGLAALARETAVLLPLALLLADVIRTPRAPLARRLPRLAPAFVAVAGAMLLLAVAGPRVVSRADPAAAGVPLDFVLAWWPAGALAGLGEVSRSAPWLVLVVPVLAIFAVPFSAPGKLRGHELTTALRLSAGVTLLGLLPVLFMPGSRRAEVFGVAALGACIALGAGLARTSPWVARASLAFLALASLGANSLPSASARFAGYAHFREQSARTAPLLSALEPWCASLARLPRTFAAAIPPDSTFRLVIGPGARVACRDPAITIRFLAELTADDAGGPFGVLRFDAQGGRFLHEPADARVRARVGEGLLVYARHEAAAACFGAAVAERPDDPELVYPWVVALAAADQTAEARGRWHDARRKGLAPAADTLAMRLLAGLSGPAADSSLRVATRLASAVVADPTAATPHLDLGRHLLAVGRARSATIEFSVGSHISRRSQDLYWLARGYDALGSRVEALETYRAALAGGLDTVAYVHARTRVAELLSIGTPLSLPPTPLLP